MEPLVPDRPPSWMLCQGMGKWKKKNLCKTMYKTRGLMMQEQMMQEIQGLVVVMEVRV